MTLCDAGVQVACAAPVRRVGAQHRLPAPRLRPGPRRRPVAGARRPRPRPVRQVRLGAPARHDAADARPATELRQDRPDDRRRRYVELQLQLCRFTCAQKLTYIAKLICRGSLWWERFVKKVDLEPGVSPAVIDRVETSARIASLHSWLPFYRHICNNSSISSC